MKNYDRLATFETPVRSIDAASGSEVVTWSPLALLSASPQVAEQFWVNLRDVKPSRSEAVQNGLQVARNQTVLTMRWRADVTSEARVTVHGDTDVVYQIVGGPAEVSGKKRELEMVLECFSS